jgi:uncharacterized membrane protein YhaH (DUF805 family)
VIAVMTIVRRLHDRSLAWTSVFIGLIPYVGWAWLVIYLVGQGDTGENGYGPDPREVRPAG